jgi:hypothetical protein
MRSILVASVVLMSVPVLVLACSGAPENPGDSCELDGDPCPDGLVCQAKGDDDPVCRIEAGGTCDREEEDPWCEKGTSCTAVEGGSKCLVQQGETCDPNAADPFCAPGLICGTGADGQSFCGKPPGADCSPVAPEPECAPPLVCEPDSDGHTFCGIPEGGACDPTAPDPYCAGDNVCAEKASGGHACYPPILVRGRVFDAVTTTGIANAHVLGLDDQATAITDIAISAADGTYELDLPVARNDDGTPVEVTFTLRSSAQDYQPFPSGLRTSLPIETSGATKQEKVYVIQLPLTDISLIPLPAAEQGQPSISGTVVAGEFSAGVLVVAEAGGKGLTAVSSKSGAYTIFNVPNGSYTVSGYAAGVVLNPATASVAGSPLTGIDLSQAGAAGGSVSGNVQIVNAPGGSLTSVVLVVESTFDDTFVRGEVPRGLRTPLSGPPNVSGSFSIAGVPPGRYVVLAGFENDGLVRDPDPNIAGTQIVHLEMPNPGTPMEISDSFKITEALAVVGPGADGPEGVSGMPTFVWQDDSSEDFYSIVVYDAFGNLVWENPDVPSQSGGDNVSVPYGGPALTPGMYYQFRATSWRSPGGNPGPISQTEDLRGVFFVQ